MPTQQLLDRVPELREAGRTPKEIARALKMPPGAVASLIRSAAAAEGWIREETLIG
jgi:transcriptional regulator